MLVDIFRESIQSTHLFINTWTQQLIKCKLLPSICSQLYVVWYGEIGSWTLVWFKVCLTTDSPSIVPTFCSGQVGRINVIDTSVRMICAESSWRTFRVSNNLNDFFSSFSALVSSFAAERQLNVRFSLVFSCTNHPRSQGLFPAPPPSSLGGAWERGWPPTCDDLHRLGMNWVDFELKFVSKTTKFLTVWPSKASRHKLMLYGFLSLAWTCEPTCESVWPPIASPYAINNGILVPVIGLVTNIF